MKKIVNMLVGAMLVVTTIAVVCTAAPQETTSPWNDTYDAVSVTVTNGMAIGLIGQKLILTSTTIASGTNALTLTTPFPFKGPCVIQVKSGTTNHITFATNTVLRASGNITLVPGGVNDTVILSTVSTNKALVIGSGSAY